MFLEFSIALNNTCSKKKKKKKKTENGRKIKHNNSINEDAPFNINYKEIT